MTTPEPTEYIVFRAAPGLPKSFLGNLEGQWFYRIGMAALSTTETVLVHTDRYERREDGEFAQVIELQKIGFDPVVISAKELKQLRKDSDWLGWLESAGVDNWNGIDYARELRRNDRKSRMGDPL